MANFCTHAGEVPVIIQHHLKSIDNSQFKDSHSHPIHTYFVITASNVLGGFWGQGWEGSVPK